MPDDLPAIAAIAQEVHAFHASARPDLFQPPTAPVATPIELAHLAAEPGHLLLVATEGGDVLGYAHAAEQVVAASAYKRASALLHVHAMGVAAARRGRGVGTALLSALREEAARRGLDGLSLEVYAFNDDARRFYAREGFVGERERLVTRVPRATPAP